MRSVLEMTSVYLETIVGVRVKLREKVCENDNATHNVTQLSALYSSPQQCLRRRNLTLEYVREKRQRDCVD